MIVVLVRAYLILCAVALHDLVFPIRTPLLTVAAGFLARRRTARNRL